MISMPGAQELLIILVIALVIVGPQRLPELSRSVGRGLREFRKIQDEVKDMVKIDLNPVEPPTVHQPGVSGPRKPTVHRTGRSTSSTSPAAAKRAAEAASETEPEESSADSVGTPEGTTEQVAPTEPPEAAAAD